MRPPLTPSILVFLLLLCGGRLFAIHPDSLIQALTASRPDTNRVNLLTELAFEYAYKDPASSLRLSEAALHLADSLQYPYGAAFAVINMARTYRLHGQSDKAITQLTAALARFEKNRDDYNCMRFHNELGNTLKDIGQFEESSKHYHESLRLSERIHYDEGIGSVCLNLGDLYYSQEDYAQVQRMSERAMKAFRDARHISGVAAAMTMAGQACYALKNYTQALDYTNEAYRILKQEGDLMQLAVVLNALGTIHQEMRHFPEALAYYEESLVLDDSLGNMEGVAISYSNLAGIYSEMGQQAKALAYFDKARDKAQENGHLESLMTIMKYTSEAWRDQGDYHKAWDFRMQYEQIRDSMFSETRAAQLIQIREEYDAEKREEDIQTLQREKDLLESRNRLFYFLLAAAILILAAGIIIVLLYLRYRRHAAERQQRELEQKALRAQMNPHFIFNSLNSIQRLFMEGQFDQAHDYMGDFGSLLRTVLENSGKPRISLKDELHSLRLYLDLESMRTGGLITYSIDTDPEVDVLNIHVPPLIIQPYVENAIWHGILPQNKAGHIALDIRFQEEDTLLCTVTDDGIGIDNSRQQKMQANHTSRGMEITQARLGNPNAVRAEQLSTGGTRITLLIPIQS